MEEYKIPGISGLDTRKLARSIRDLGSRRGIITSADTTVEEALEKIKNTPVPHDAVSKVSCKKRWYSRTANAKYNVVAIDCGIKLNIIRSLNLRGCNVTVMPYNTTADEVIKCRPDGIFISNGPGYPEDVTPGNEQVKARRGKNPKNGNSLHSAVREESLAGTGLTVTHLNILDGTVEGVKDAENKIFSVQYHPESAPGPQDSAYLFDQFIALMEDK